MEDDLFEYALRRLSGLDSIKVVRIGTRAPVSDPTLVNARKLAAIESIEQPVYVGIHFEHPAEISSCHRALSKGPRARRRDSIQPDCLS